MSARLDPITIADTHEFEGKLEGLEFFKKPAILLSAGVPDIRPHTADMTVAEREYMHALCTRYIQMSQPAAIRSAVLEITKTALRRKVQLIFGAHPMISPTVLDVARNTGAGAASILIFQSEFFAGQIPGSTLDLANWSAGRLFFTPRQHASRDYEARTRSLTTMRTLMVSPNNLLGAIFVGGMDGLEEEARLFQSTHQKLPCYAIASTGSAALDLFNRGSRNWTPGTAHEFAGSLADPDVLKGTSYSLIARKILDDMRVPTPGRTARP